MHWLGPILAVIGVIALLYGFSKNSRKILVVAGILLFFGGAFGDMLAGFKAGVMSQAPASTDSAP